MIRLGVDPEFVPFEFIDENGEYKGIAADYLSLISEKTGLQFELSALQRAIQIRTRKLESARATMR